MTGAVNTGRALYYGSRALALDAAAFGPWAAYQINANGINAAGLFGAEFALGYDSVSPSALPTAVGLTMRERILANIEATRAGSASSQFEFHATVEDLLEKRIGLGLTSNAKMGRNFAYSEYKLNGDVGGGFALSGKSSPAGAVGIPRDRMFSTMIIGWDRAYDTEVKLLESIAQRYNPQRVEVVPGVTGSVDLYSELVVCYSCSRVIGQFQDMFPNVKVNVQSGPNASKPVFR